MSQALARDLPAFGGMWDQVVHDPLAVLKETRDRIDHDPMIRQYLSPLIAADDFSKAPRKTVTDILARRMVWTLVLAAVENIDLGHAAPELAALCLMLESSIPYLWDALLFEMAVIGEMPPHIIGPQLPFPYVWLTFDRAVRLEGVDCDSEAVLLVETDNCLLGITFGIGGKNETRVRKLKNLPYGTPFHEAPAPWPALLSALSFTDSPYVIKTQQGLNRHERRRFERGAAEDQPISEVLSFIKLRRAKYEADSEAARTEHHHRWLVRCHRRAQWYPSMQSHKIIWIKAHIKGPEDAPMKIAAYKVDR